MIAYFVHGTPVEDTIYRCDDIHKFQIIAKAGGGYRSVFLVPTNYEDWKKEWQKANRYRVLNKHGKQVWKQPSFTWHNYHGPRQEVQKVNRVYASVLPNQGTLVKIKPDGTLGKIGGLPDSCIVDSKNQLTIEDVDRSWYVNVAKKYIEDYTGEEYKPCM